MLFLAFMAIAVQVGFGDHLIAYALPFGPTSMLLAWLNARRRRKFMGAADAALAPFPSVSSLLAVRRRVRGFLRHRYPRAVSARRIRDPITEKLMWVPWGMMWCMFSPVALLFQMLPDREAQTRIKLFNAPADASVPPCATAL